MTKQNFLEEYRATLVYFYDWAKDDAKLNLFMAKVDAALSGTGQALWYPEGGAAREAWVAIGGEGKPTLAKLRALEVRA